MAVPDFEEEAAEGVETGAACGAGVDVIGVAEIGAAGVWVELSPASSADRFIGREMSAGPLVISSGTGNSPK